MDLNKDFEEVFIDVPWGKMSVMCYGELEWPTILMVHGNQDSASTFCPLLEFFPKNFRLILPELPSCGHSTPFPVGRPLAVLDFVSPIKMVIDHFKLEKFIYIGHSMGFQIGYYFNVIYPGHVTKFISLDSVSYPPVEPSTFPDWFKRAYENFYDPNNYKKFSSPESTPTYTYEKALANVMKSRDLTETAGKAVLMRCLIPGGDGQFRFCWDQRLKLINMPLFDSQYQLTVFGKIKIPHLTLLASGCAKRRLAISKLHMLKAHFVNNPFYRLVMVEGNHDVHLNDPKTVASHVVPFLNDVDASKEETYRLVHVCQQILDDIESSKLE